MAAGHALSLARFVGADRRHAVTVVGALFADQRAKYRHNSETDSGNDHRANDAPVAGEHQV